MYGSSLRLVTRMPREARIAAREAAAMPFPREETTPPVTNTNFVMGDKFRKLLVYRNRLPRTNRWGRWARHGVGKIVVPAKAGIHFSSSRRRPGSNLMLTPADRHYRANHDASAQLGPGLRRGDRQAT